MDGSTQSHFKVIVTFRSSLFGDLGMTEYGLGARLNFLWQVPTLTWTLFFRVDSEVIL